MAMEPITLYSRNADPGLAARKLRELAPGVKLDGNDEHWRNAVITLGHDSRTLTITHDPEYYQGSDWQQQMAGMRGYFSRYPDSERKPMLLMLTTSFQFALGTLFDPDCESNDDPRLKVLYDLAEALDGVLFSPSAMRDARGRTLCGAGGEEFDDPDAVWPRVLAAVDISDPLGQEIHHQSKPNPDVDDATEAPTALRVARRALALCAVTARAILEQHPSNLNSINTGQPLWSRWARQMIGGYVFWNRSPSELTNWVKKIGIEDELEPDEWEALQRPLGKMDERMQIHATWRLEGLVVLAWALGHAATPPVDELVSFYLVWKRLGLLNVDVAQRLLSQPTLRPREEIRTKRGQFFAAHWRLRNFQLNREVLNFAEFAKTCWFGPLDISGMSLNDGDLELQGARLDRRPRHIVGTALSAAMERHKAANWLWDGPVRFSESSEDT